MLRQYIFGGLLILMWWSVAPHISAQSFQLPLNDGFVTDSAGLLSASQKQDLEQKLTVYRQQTSNEIAIVTVKSLGGFPIEQAALKILREWGVGDKDKNNGLVLLVASEDRIMRIEVGNGLEGPVPDMVANGVIETDLVPAFRQGKYYEGISAAINSLEKHLGGEFTADRYNSHDSGFSPFPTLLIVFIFLQWMLAIMGRTKSWWLGGVFGAIAGIILNILYGWWWMILLVIPVGLVLDFIVSRNYNSRKPTRWWAGGGWGPGGRGPWGGGLGSGGNGGFGGFGGGTGGGGGASGRW